MNSFLNKFLKGLAYLPTVIMGVESVFGPKQGTTKKAQADEIVNTIMDTVNSVANGQIIDSKLFNEGKDEAIEGILKCLKATKAFKDIEKGSAQ